MQVAAKDKGATDDKLVTQIHEPLKAGKITTDLKKMGGCRQMG